MRATVALFLSALTLAVVSRLAADAPPANPFYESVVPDPSFRFQGDLTCEVLRATYPNFVGDRFTLRSADTNVVLRSWSRDAAGQKMPRIYENPERVVFQLAGDEPGSVDTLSIDKTNGTFARTWSGWTLESKELGAGGERGRCFSSRGGAGGAR